MRAISLKYFKDKATTKKLIEIIDLWCLDLDRELVDYSVKQIRR